MKDEERYTIGQMAELCNISKRILRYYDQNGIVIPSWRDKDTNYRYYTRDQIQQVLLLQELRELSVPVKTIARLFPGRDLLTFETELEQHLGELRREMADLQTRYDRTMDVFIRVVRGRTAIEDVRSKPDAEIQTVYFHRRTVAFAGQSGLQDAGRVHRRCRTELMKILSDYGLKPVGPYMAFYGKGEVKTAELELLVEVKAGKPGCNCRCMEGFEALSCVCTGPYEKLDACYREMEAYARENGILLEGTRIEEYLVGTTMTSKPEEYITRLYLPVRKA